MRMTMLPVGIFVVLAFPACREGSKSSTAVQVAVGDEHACAAFTDGSVRCWGAWGHGQRGDGVRLNAFPKKSLRAENLDLRPEAQPATNRVINLDEVVEVAAEHSHTCARRKDGSVWCWGGEGTGTDRLDQSHAYPIQVKGVTDAVQLASGASHTCARRSDGSVWCWGESTYNQLGARLDGQPGAVQGIANAIDLRAAGNLSCALLAGGSVVCWGVNGSRQRGDGSPAASPSASPTPVIGVNDGVQIDVAGTHACVRTRAGKVLCWGSNENGQMGDGTAGYGDQRDIPVEVAPLAGVSELWVSFNATCGRKNDGAVVCVGGGGGLLWELPGMRSASQVALAQQTIPLWTGPFKVRRPSGCAVMKNGALMCWGAFVPRESGRESGTQNPVQVRW